MEKITMEIDGKSVEIEENKTIMDAAKEAEIDIPTICLIEFWDERPETCRMCVVEITGGGPPELVTSCSQPVAEGLEVETDSDKVYTSRRNTLALFLSRHYLECRNCPKSGECELVELSKEYDVSYLPVCADCKLQGKSCLLSKGEICLGPLTYAGCDAVCTAEDYRCIACRGINFNKDIVRFAQEAYEEKGIPFDEVLEEVKDFSVKKYEKLKQLAGEQEE